MKNTWIIWVLIVGVVVTVLIAFNHQGKENVPLSDLFSEQKATQNVEYEFVQNGQPPVADITQKQVPSATVPAVETPAAPTAVSESTSAGMKNIPFTIQVASFKDKAKAEKVVNDLNKNQFSAYIVANTTPDKGTWYRVYAGKFETKDQAEASLTKIKATYKESFIISPKKGTK